MSAAVGECVLWEQSSGFDQARTYKEFAVRMESVREQLRDLLTDLKKQGIRLTLKQIADKTSYDYGYVRNMFSLWEKLTGQDHQ